MAMRSASHPFLIPNSSFLIKMMTIVEYIKKLQNNPAFMDNVTSWHVMPARPAAYGEYPPELDGRIVETLKKRGIHRPYIHQSQAIRAALADVGLFDAPLLQRFDNAPVQLRREFAVDRRPRRHHLP